MVLNYNLVWCFTLSCRPSRLATKDYKLTSRCASPLKLQILSQYVLPKRRWRTTNVRCLIFQNADGRNKSVNNCPTRCNNIQFIYIWKLLYMFRVVSPPIIRSSYHCIYSIWHYWDRYCYLSRTRSRQVAVTVSIMPDTVDTVIWAPDDGWRYHPKHVQQFADVNKLYIVASCWTIIDTYYTMHGPLNIT